MDQGLSGIVKVQSNEYAKYLDELIQEGLIKACKTGGSLGHPESNIFYMPVKGYNVWEDDSPVKYLDFIRLYLGVIDNQAKGTMIDPKLSDFIQNVDIISEYCKWLSKNDKELKELLSLDDFYKEENVILTPDEIDWVKTRNWYKTDQKVLFCLENSIDYINKDLDKKILSINNELINLYKYDDKYKSDLIKAKKEIENLGIHMNYRIRVNTFLKSQDQNLNIKSVIK